MSDFEITLDDEERQLLDTDVENTNVNTKFVRIDSPSDPDRCQAVGKHGQCPFKKVPGSTGCPRHRGVDGLTRKANEAARTFRLQQWQTRVSEFADDGKIKSLREEIGILRLLLEEQMNACTTPQMLLINSHKISDFVMKLDKLVVSCHNMEMKMGMLLDRNSILQLGSLVVEIISRYITGSDERERASMEIVEALTTTVITK